MMLLILPMTEGRAVAAEREGRDMVWCCPDGRHWYQLNLLQLL